MAIYTKSGGEIKSVTPYLKRNGEIITPSSVWVKTGGEVHKVWPVEEPVPEGPFEIYDQATLEEFRDRVNAGEYDLDAVVTADFSMNGTWEIGIGGQSSSTAYMGTFDGDDHTITGLTIESTDGYAGMFNFLGSGGTVRGVTLSEASVTAKTHGSHCVGGIVVYNYGTVEGCTNEGTVTATSSAGYVGGIVGYNYGNVEDNHNAGEVSGRANVGGIVGYNMNLSTVTGNTNEASVTTTATSSAGYAGGIAGYNNMGTIERCHNGGNAYGYYAGGIAGHNSGNVVGQGTVTDCTNEGDVTAPGPNSCGGGIVGRNTGTVTDCTNTGTVTGTNITELSATDESTSAAGGIVGYNVEGSTVEGNTNEGEASGAAHTGDIIGMEGPAKEEDVPEEAASTEEE